MTIENIVGTLFFDLAQIDQICIQHICSGSRVDSIAVWYNDFEIIQ